MSTQSGRLEGKVAIITGAASGFGLAISQVFIKEGCKLVAADLNAEALEKHFGTTASVTTAIANVTSLADWTRLVSLAKEKYGRLDALVNNAGTSYRNKPTLEVTEEEYDRVMNVNVKSIFHSVRAVMPYMIEQGRPASIINIASIGALRPRGGLVWYSTSKGAVVTASKALASEYGPNQIRINAICPLLSATGLFEAFSGMPDTPENREKLTANVPMGRLTETIDVAKAALYLAGDESTFLTGVALEVDGGRGI